MYCSMLITATGHIKLTDFGLSKTGLMNCMVSALDNFMLFYATRICSKLPQCILL